MTIYTMHIFIVGKILTQILSQLKIKKIGRIRQASPRFDIKHFRQLLVRSEVISKYVTVQGPSVCWVFQGK
jgi:hypothetical protein